MQWRGEFTSDEVESLHAEAFGHDVGDWDWRSHVEAHSLGWVVARVDGELVGFLNVLWDGATHAWLQDVMVARSGRRRGVGKAMVAVAVSEARTAGCEWLHVDFDDEDEAFYIEACGFTPAKAGLIHLD